MLKLLQRSISEILRVFQTTWAAVCGMLTALAALFGYRPARPVAVHAGIDAEDVDTALRHARSEHEHTPTPSDQFQLDAGLDLVWSYVNAAAEERPRIDLSPLGEHQRNWLLGLGDEEIADFAQAGRIAVARAALQACAGATARPTAALPSPQAPYLSSDSSSGPSRAELIRDTLASRIVRGSERREQSAWSITEDHDPAFDDTIMSEVAFRP